MTSFGGNTSITEFKILCVGYEKGITDQISAAVQDQHQHTVTTSTAHTAESAIKQAHQNDIDCLISEHHLDSGSGVEIIEAVENTPVVMFIKDGSETIASEAILAGADEYIPRNGDKEEYQTLGDRVAKLIEKYQTDGSADPAITDIPVDSLPLILFMINPKGIFIRSQGQGLSNIGIEPGQIVGESLYELYGNLPTAIDGYETALAGEQSFVTLEINDRILETTFAPMGSFEQGVIGLALDVTEQTAAEQEALQLHTAIEATMDGIAILDEDEEYVYVNESHAKMYGFDDPDTMIGKSWQILYNSDELERFEQEIMTSLNQEEEWRGEAVGTRTDGSQFPQELTLTALDSGGLVCGVRDITERRKQEQYLARLMDNLPGMTYRCANEPEWPMEFVRGSCKELSGHDAETIESDAITWGKDVIHPDDQHEVWETVQDAVANQERFEIEYRILSDSGEMKWVWEQGISIHDESGELVALEGFITGITERKELRDKLEQARNELQSVLDNALALIHKRDLEGRYQYVNDQFKKFFNKEEIVGKTPGELFDNSELVGHVNESDREAIESGESVRNEENIWVDGQRHTFLTATIPLLDNDGDPYAIYGIATETTEITDRERILQSLNETAPRFMSTSSTTEIAEIAVETVRDVLNLPIAGIWIYDSEQNALVPSTTTAQAAELFDNQPVFQPNQGLAWKVFENKDPQIREDVADDPNVYNPDTPIKSEMIFPLGEHGILICSSLQYRQINEYDREFGTILAATTTSALTRAGRESTIKQRERELERKNDRLNEFADVAAHDIRNPLAVVKGYLGLEREERDSPHLEMAEEAIDRTFVIVDNLLSLARVGEQVGEMEPIEIENVAQQAWSTVLADEAQLLLDIKLVIDGDRLRMTQLFENLFRNAIEHGGHDVTVRVGELDRTQGFYIEDDGPGISKEKRETLLTDCRVRDEDNERRFGLSIVTEIVDAHGWDISITGGTDGGARFEIMTAGKVPTHSQDHSKEDHQ
ncbi:PAS domain-containing protein [Natronorubrum halophilum]|uniref:PAS domain-containing protein n=1 Tax=Natronorubrum halophilum TaxID=1702106 RepID=UPI0010C1EAE9|nr:PAS domain-containing protein [Natronorubrum halophilum]